MQCWIASHIGGTFTEGSEVTLMSCWSRLRRAMRLSGLVSAAVLAGGCAVPPTAAPYASPATSLLSYAGSNARVYISAGDEVEVYKYAQDYFLESLTGLQSARGECSSASGELFVANYGDGDVLSFLPGAKHAQYIADPSPYPVDCSTDPTTGSLAVANEYGTTQSSSGNVAIYSHAKGKPKVYQYGGFSKITSCAYDGAGDLIVTGYKSSLLTFAYLPPRAKKLESLSVEVSADWRGPAFVRWDGMHIVIAFENNFDGLIFVRYKLKHGIADETGATAVRLSDIASSPFWVGRVHAARGNANAIASATTYGVYFWSYPAGTLLFEMGYGIDSYGTGITVIPTR